MWHGAHKMDLDLSAFFPGGMPLEDYLKSGASYLLGEAQHVNKITVPIDMFEKVTRHPRILGGAIGGLVLLALVIILRNVRRFIFLGAVVAV